MKTFLNSINMKNLKIKLIKKIKILFKLSLFLIGHIFSLTLVILALVFLFFCLPYIFTVLGWELGIIRFVSILFKILSLFKTNIICFYYFKVKPFIKTNNTKKNKFILRLIEFKETLLNLPYVMCMPGLLFLSNNEKSSKILEGRRYVSITKRDVYEAYSCEPNWPHIRDVLLKNFVTSSNRLLSAFNNSHPTMREAELLLDRLEIMAENLDKAICST